MSTLVGLAVSGKGDTCSTSSNNTPTPSQGLYQPTGLAIDSSNNLYIADSKHNCIRMLANGAAGVAALTTVAGTCGSAASAQPQRSSTPVTVCTSPFRTPKSFPLSASIRSFARHQTQTLV